MPWAIWPSLMILWGVFWMFAVPMNDASHLDVHFEEFPLNPDLESVPQNYDHFRHNIGSQVIPHLPTDYSNYGMNNDFAGELFDQEILAPLPSSAAVDLPRNTGSDFEYSLNGLTRIENVDQVMLNDTIGDFRTQMPSANQQAGSENHKRHSAPYPPAASLLLSYVLLGKKYLTYSNRTHVNQHTRPFICSVEECPSRSATNDVLVRHKLLKHSLGRSMSPGSLRASETNNSSGPEGTEPAFTSDPGTPSVVDKGKGRAKGKFADAEDEEEVNDYNEQDTGSRTVQKKAMLTGRVSTQREEKVAQEDERLREELKMIQEEIFMCRAERDEKKTEHWVTKQMKQERIYNFMNFQLHKYIALLLNYRA
ncbi:hypothetical protein BKA64DRAFT_636006 [Cadophora sp. MPI-SDFR-AT-0126]|nr:hypothetical protein BKA64DRAFT_636006 [Leotiomycetes sp. MPI-SDFR-AT-0126]